MAVQSVSVGSVLRNEGVKSVVGTVRDKVTAARIRSAGGSDGLGDLDLACRKATSHEDVIPKEKHVITLKQVCCAVYFSTRPQSDTCWESVVGFAREYVKMSDPYHTPLTPLTILVAGAFGVHSSLTYCRHYRFSYPFHTT
jgi:hypothetical protein